MIRINLLPYHLRPIKRTPIPYIISGLVLIIALLVMAAMFISKQSVIGEKRRLHAEYTEELATLDVIVKKANELAIQKEQLAEKIKTIDEIVRDRITWSRQLWNLSRLAPENLWFSDISVETKHIRERRTEIDPKTNQLKTTDVTIQRSMLKVSGYVIEGPDGSNDVSPFALATEQDPEFSKLFQIETSSLKDMDFEGYSVKSFTLEYRIWSGGGEG